MLQAEAALEHAFRANTMDETFLKAALAEIGALQALGYVLFFAPISQPSDTHPDQIEQYNLAWICHRKYP
jgi:hypothetical protein